MAPSIKLGRQVLGATGYQRPDSCSPCSTRPGRQETNSSHCWRSHVRRSNYQLPNGDSRSGAEGEWSDPAGGRGVDHHHAAQRRWIGAGARLQRQGRRRGRARTAAGRSSPEGNRTFSTLGLSTPDRVLHCIATFRRSDYGQKDEINEDATRDIAFSGSVPASASPLSSSLGHHSAGASTRPQPRPPRQIFLELLQRHDRAPPTPPGLPQGPSREAERLTRRWGPGPPPRQPGEKPWRLPGNRGIAKLT